MDYTAIPNLLFERHLGLCSRRELQHALRAIPRSDALNMLRSIVLWQRYSDWMRTQAIEALELLGGPEALDVLIEALKHAKAPSRDLVGSIVEALQRFPSRKARWGLWYVARRGQWPDVRREAIFSLAVLGDVRVAPILRRMMRRVGDSEQRLRARVALMWLHYRKGRTHYLLHALKSRPADTTRALLSLFRELPDRCAFSLLLLARNNPAVGGELKEDLDRRLSNLQR